MHRYDDGHGSVDDAVTAPLEKGWLKESLEDARRRVAKWPKWKIDLENATTRRLIGRYS